MRAVLLPQRYVPDRLKACADRELHRLIDPRRPIMPADNTGADTGDDAVVVVVVVRVVGVGEVDIRQEGARDEEDAREEYSAASPQMAICSRRNSCVERGRGCDMQKYRLVGKIASGVEGRCVPVRARKVVMC